MFTRKSTGLVRQGSWLDSFVFNSSSSFLFGPLIFALSALSWLRGDDLISAEVIALGFCLAIAAMYAIMTANMPRSGGDYVFNSRILHPSIGFAFNFSLWIWQLFSAAFTLYFVTNYALSPGLLVLGFYSGNQTLSAAGNFLGEPINSLIFATILNIVFTVVFALGIKKTFRILNVLWSVTILGTVVMIVSLALTHLSSFEGAFNGYVRSVNGTGTVSNPFAYVQSASYSQLGSGLVLPAIAICASSVIWVFWETYVAGEVRRSGIAKRNFSTMGGAAVINGALFIAFIFLLYRSVTPSFISGLANLSYPGGLFSSPLQSITATVILASGNFYSALLVVVAITLGTTVLLLPALYLQPIRSMFAWSIDGILPAKVSQVNEKYHTPIFSTALVFVIIEGALIVITAEYQSLLTIFFAVIIAPAFSSVFPTAISAILSPIRRKSLGTGRGSTKLITTPLLGLISLAFILFMTYVFVANEGSFYLTNTLVLLNFIFIPIGFGIYFISYYFAKSRHNIDLNLIAKEIPPE